MILIKLVFFGSRPALQVSLQADKPNAYRSIQQAFRQARPGDVIELHDEVLEENLVVDADFPANVMTLAEPHPGKTVRWTTGKKAKDERLIQIVQAKNFPPPGARASSWTAPSTRSSRLRELVVIGSQCPGLVVEGLRCENFERAAIVIRCARGTQRDPIRLSKLHIKARSTGTGQGRRRHIYFDAAVDARISSASDFVWTSSDCDFTNLDVDHEVGRKDANVVGKNVNWPFR